MGINPIIYAHDLEIKSEHVSRLLWIAHCLHPYSLDRSQFSEYR